MKPLILICLIIVIGCKKEVELIPDEPPKVEIKAPILEHNPDGTLSEAYIKANTWKITYAYKNHDNSCRMWLLFEGKNVVQVQNPSVEDFNDPKNKESESMSGERLYEYLKRK